MPQSIKPPAACQPHELENFKAMLLLSEQEGEEGLDERIEQAALLAFHYDDKRLMAISALKRANIGYLKGIFKKAGIPERDANYALEFGWVYTQKEYRRKGIIPILLQRLVERSDGQAIFAVIRLSDQELAASLKKQGFVAGGEPFFRHRKNYKHQVYLRDAPVTGP